MLFFLGEKSSAQDDNNNKTETSAVAYQEKEESLDEIMNLCQNIVKNTKTETPQSIQVTSGDISTSEKLNVIQSDPSLADEGIKGKTKSEKVTMSMETASLDEKKVTMATTEQVREEEKTVVKEASEQDEMVTMATTFNQEESVTNVTAERDETFTEVTSSNLEERVVKVTTELEERILESHSTEVIKNDGSKAVVTAISLNLSSENVCKPAGRE